MKTAWMVWLAGAVTLAWTAGAARAAEKAGSNKKSPYFVVVKSVGVHNEVTFEAIPSGDYTERRKELPKLYKEAMTEYEAARKEARAKHEKFAEKRPVTPSITQVGNKFKKEEEAQTFASKLQERWDAIHNKDKGKEEGKTTKEKEKEGDGAAQE